jgi:hypothetical protein
VNDSTPAGADRRRVAGDGLKESLDTDEGLRGAEVLGHDEAAALEQPADAADLQGNLFRGRRPPPLAVRPGPQLGLEVVQVFQERPPAVLVVVVDPHGGQLRLAGQPG